MHPQWRLACPGGVKRSTQKSRSEKQNILKKAIKIKAFLKMKLQLGLGQQSTSTAEAVSEVVGREKEKASLKNPGHGRIQPSKLLLPRKVGPVRELWRTRQKRSF
jgi:hypothetical protein